MYAYRMIIVMRSVELDVGAVVGVGPPVGRDDVVGHERLAGLAADAQREGRPQRVVGVQAPDGAPGAPHRGPVARAGLAEVHLQHGPCLVGVLDQHREVDGVGALLHVEVDGEPPVVAGHPPELDVDDAGVAELVVEARPRQGAERGAAEVEVVLGHRVVVHVRDHHPLGLAGAGGVVLTGALYLKFKQNVKRCARHVEFDRTNSTTLLVGSVEYSTMSLTSRKKSTSPGCSYYSGLY
jgi:hypothetical protein